AIGLFLPVVEENLLNSAILKFGLEIIDMLMKDERFSFNETDLQIYADGLSADNSELAEIIADTNKVYHNSKNEVLNGNYLICNIRADKNTETKTIMRFKLDAYYKDAMKSDTETIKETIAQEILTHNTGTELDDILIADNYENLKSRLMIRAINFAKNSVRLEDAVYDRFGDMAICAYMKVSHNDVKFTSAKVTKDILEKYNISAEQIMQDAINNSCILYPERLFFSISELCSKQCNGLSADEALERVKNGELKINKLIPMIAVTNTAHLNGASAMFYPGVAEKISEIFGGDYYAVFISIHEVYLHPKNMFTPSQLKRNLIATNNQFNDEDVLTYRIYRYDSKRKQVTSSPA
ncbi:MAG: hypothetical protein K2J71_01300, partial [Oscillospiraceae bacterium]|nr:hypothetical protein [Oscillospiraceae bacterium]